MNINIKSLVIMTCMLLPFAAAANTVPASSGRPQTWSDGTCFWMSGSGMSNGCSSTKSFEIPLLVGSHGPKTVEVTAQGATPSSNVCCVARGMFRDNSSGFPSNRGVPVCLSSFSSPQVISLTGAFVPHAGYLFVNCQVDPGAWVHSVNYTP